MSFLRSEKLNPTSVLAPFEKSLTLTSVMPVLPKAGIKTIDFIDPASVITTFQKIESMIPILG